jgi:hypothetical protein
MRRTILIGLVVLTFGCGVDSTPVPGTFRGAGGMDGVGGMGGMVGVGGAGGTAGTPVVVPLSGLWDHTGASNDVFCFNVSADGTQLEAAGSACGPNMSVVMTGGEDPCWFTVSTAATIPIVDSEFSLVGQEGDTVECAFWSPSQVECRVLDAERGCIREVSGDLGPQ